MAKVKVISTSNGPVSVRVPQANFQREWLAKGASVMIEQETLEDLLYDTGFKYMIDSGMLYIEDLAIKKALGLEPEDATAPVNIIVLSDAEKQRWLTTMTLSMFKEKVKTLNYEQVNALIDYAIDHRHADLDKCKILKTLTGRDIIQTIRLNDANKED